MFFHKKAPFQPLGYDFGLFSMEMALFFKTKVHCYTSARNTSLCLVESRSHGGHQCLTRAYQNEPRLLTKCQH